MKTVVLCQLHFSQDLVSFKIILILVSVLVRIFFSQFHDTCKLCSGALRGAVTRGVPPDV